MTKELPLFTTWLEVTSEVLDRAGRFPKNLRPTLGNRLIDRTLTVLDAVVALRYSREREPLFRQANIDIERCRILVRIAFERRLVSGQQYHRLAASIDTAGRMLGGWMRSQRGEPGSTGGRR